MGRLGLDVSAVPPPAWRGRGLGQHFVVEVGEGHRTVSSSEPSREDLSG